MNSNGHRVVGEVEDNALIMHTSNPECLKIEEVLAHVHLGPINLDVLTRQHEHSSGLIWTGDHETYITRVYIGNPARRSTWTYGYQPAGVDRRMVKVDDITTGVLEGPLSSPTRYTSVIRKVQTIICRCIVSIGGMLGCTPSEHDIRVKRGTRRLPGGRARGGHAPTPPHLADGDV
ncbi:hypothetical protein M9H77_06916 [Catharanthus roseus]|uniref:Uncharacterized protein n=1 Tax=Catharanthus roseus TaxID=4058 RepID=A0ACC0BTJ8_CATRO|nr:hypothetical protein M9H77_06916 [Catharanthus roseus]